MPITMDQDANPSSDLSIELVSDTDAWKRSFKDFHVNIVAEE